MTIGDLGKAPGNDFELLAEPFSLSVDQVSEASATCWNLAPIGCHGANALLGYLRAFEVRTGKGTFKVARVRCHKHD